MGKLFPNSYAVKFDVASSEDGFFVVGYCDQKVGGNIGFYTMLGWRELERKERSWRERELNPSFGSIMKEGFGETVGGFF